MGEWVTGHKVACSCGPLLINRLLFLERCGDLFLFTSNVRNSSDEKLPCMCVCDGWLGGWVVGRVGDLRDNVSRGAVDICFNADSGSR